MVLAPAVVHVCDVHGKHTTGHGGFKIFYGYVCVTCTTLSKTTCMYSLTKLTKFVELNIYQ